MYASFLSSVTDLAYLPGISSYDAMVRNIKVVNNKDAKNFLLLLFQI